MFLHYDNDDDDDADDGNLRWAATPLASNPDFENLVFALVVFPTVYP